VDSSTETLVGYLSSVFSQRRGESEDDRELLRRFAQAHDGDAFAALMRRHGLIALKRIGTPEARRVLEAVAQGSDSARLTRQAWAGAGGHAVIGTRHDGLPQLIGPISGKKAGGPPLPVNSGMGGTVASDRCKAT
jgi:hypothetical protein